MAEQEKRSPKERPILLSKDIESKLTLLDREVNYLLNKAKFAKPKAKAKAKNSTSSDKSSSKANSTAEEKVIPPTEESTDSKSGGSSSATCAREEFSCSKTDNNDVLSFHSNTETPEEAQPGDAPPTEESNADTDSDSQSQPTEETTTTGRSAKPVADNGEL